METIESQAFRLSSQQRRQWAVSREPDAAWIACLVLFEGELDPERLKRALAAVVGRHEILRTRLERRPGMRFPFQFISPEATLDWSVAETALGGPTTFDALLAQEVSRPSPSDAPPVRARLVAGTEERSALLLSVSAFSADARSLDNLVQEVAALYRGEALEEPVQYADFAEWQSGLLEDEEAEAIEGRAYWANCKGQAASGSPFPFERPTPSGAVVPARSSVTLEARLTGVLAEAADSLGVRLADLLLACWLGFLGRWRGEAKISYSVRAEGRVHEELVSALGLFAKLLPLEQDLALGLSLRSLLDGIREAVGKAEERQQYFDWESHAPEGPSCAAFEFLAPKPLPMAGGLSIRVASWRFPDDGGPFTLSCVAGDGGLDLDLRYDARRFDGGDVRRLIDGFAALVSDVGRQGPDALLCDLDLLGTAERREVLLEHQGAARGGAEFLPVHRRFEQHAAHRPKDLALAAEDVELTYAELNERANRLAHHLRGLGVGPETPVALCLERSSECIVALLAVLKAGGAFAFLEPSQAKLRLGFLLKELAAPILITEEALARNLPEHSARLVLIDADGEAIGARSSVDPENRTLPEHLAYVVFTSGSTGRPKGVAVEHRQIAGYLDGIVERLGLPAECGFASVSTLAADLGHTAVFPALCGGGCLHLLSQERSTSSERLIEYNRRFEVDLLKIVPSHLEALLACDEPKGMLPRRRLVTGGEALQWKLADAVTRWAPGLEIFNHYGPSETTVGVLTNRLAVSPRDPRSSTVPLGLPIAGVRAYVLDPLLRPVPYWMAGELAIAGRSVSRGYLGRPDLTAERFVPDPFGELAGEPGARMYRTGDRVRRLADGWIEFLGRTDNQIKFHGFRVELDELRLALNRYPEVRDSVVRVCRDGQDQPVLVAYYVSRQAIEVAKLRAFLAESILEETLPNVYVHLRKLPLNLNGKVAFDALPTLDQVRQSTTGGSAFVASRTLTEELLAGVWAGLLGLTRVGLRDNFFELGGHSLLATQLVSRVRQIFEVDLPLRVVFEEPTLTGFASRIDRLAAGGGVGEMPSIVPAPRDDRLPLSYAQERMWFLYQLDPESPAYNSARAFEVSGRVDRHALKRALSEVVRRHESLRTTFRGGGDGQAWQVVEGATQVPVLAVDLSGLPSEARRREARRLLEGAVRRPFDLVAGPLLRALLIRQGAAEQLLALAIHHIAADAWSRGVFIRELMICYSAFAGGTAPELAPLPLQYPDFAVWQRRWIREERLEEELAYWKRQLAGASRLELPTDFLRPPVQSFRGSLASFDLARAQSERIGIMCRREGVTPFMALISIFVLLLHRISGQDDISVGTDIANRNRIEVEGLIGLFVNNVVLRTRLAGNPTFRELLQRVRELTLGAYAHQDLPFDRLVTALRPRRDPSRTPLFQVLFVVQNAPLQAFELPGAKLVPVDLDLGMCKFDLAVFVGETDGLFSMAWNYSTDLFAEETIRRLEGQFEKLLESAAERPDAPIGELEMLAAGDKERLAMEKAEREGADVQKLRGARRRSSSGAGTETLVRAELPEGRSLPLIVRPIDRDLDLVGWAGAQRGFIESELSRHGAILFRGFNVASIGEFERFAAGLCSDLYGEYGDLPREEEGGGKVYHSTPYPPDKTILFHNESSHLRRWPTKQFFYCVVPAQSGGETPIVDGRAMLRELPADLVGEVDRRKVAYVRNFTEGLDVSWRDFFRTTDRAEVERRCRELDMEFCWKGEDLETRQVCRAVLRHPRTGEAIWFNQIQLHHPACLDAETRRSMQSVFGDGNLPRNVTFGDGGPIGESFIEEITDAYWRLAVSLPWQQGDVIMLDNMLVAHARNPFVGPRKIVVAMGDILSGETLDD